MSKIGNYYLDLTEQANELGFESVQEAFDNGYEVVSGKLVEKKDEQTQAHESWLKEKEEVINGLKGLLNLWGKEYTNYELVYVLGKSQEIIGKAIEFIQKGEM